MGNPNSISELERGISLQPRAHGLALLEIWKDHAKACTTCMYVPLHACMFEMGKNQRGIKIYRKHAMKTLSLSKRAYAYPAQ